MSKNSELYTYIEQELENKSILKLVCDKLSNYTMNKIEKSFNVRVWEQRVSKNDVGVYKISKLKKKK